VYKIKNVLLTISGKRVRPTNLEKNNLAPFSNLHGYPNRKIQNNLSFFPKTPRSLFYMLAIRRVCHKSVLLKLPFNCNTSRQSLFSISYILWWCPMRFGKLNRYAFFTPSACRPIMTYWMRNDNNFSMKEKYLMAWREESFKHAVGFLRIGTA
jgi:hypothetical protein